MKRFETSKPTTTPTPIAISELMIRLRSSTKWSIKDIRALGSSSGVSGVTIEGFTGSSVMDRGLLAYVSECWLATLGGKVSDGAGAFAPGADVSSADPKDAAAV